jgi:hypothetical protein
MISAGDEACRLGDGAPAHHVIDPTPPLRRRDVGHRVARYHRALGPGRHGIAAQLV